MKSIWLEVTESTLLCLEEFKLLLFWQGRCLLAFNYPPGTSAWVPCILYTSSSILCHQAELPQLGRSLTPLWVAEQLNRGLVAFLYTMEASLWTQRKQYRRAQGVHQAFVFGVCFMLYWPWASQLNLYTLSFSSAQIASETLPVNSVGECFENVISYS
jgi:hypothetical protein